MRFIKFCHVEKFAVIAAILSVLLSTITLIANDAFAQTAGLNAPPPPPDVLWTQVQTCIEYALTNDKLNQILSYSVPTQLCVYIDAPMSINRNIGAGYTVIKEIDAARKPAAFLTLPSKMVTGIEDPPGHFLCEQPMVVVIL